MTVRELIDVLNKVEDKEMEVSIRLCEDHAECNRQPCQFHEGGRYPLLFVDADRTFRGHIDLCAIDHTTDIEGIQLLDQYEEEYAEEGKLHAEPYGPVPLIK